MYGSGPDDEPFQYADGNRLLHEPNRNGEEDLPRTSHGVAIIGDPRNNENTIVSQMQLVFRKLNNRFVTEAELEGLRGDALLENAQRRTRWPYQWVIVHDFLPKIVGPTIYKALFQFDDGGRISSVRTTDPVPMPISYMPVEFSGAAYRYGIARSAPLTTSTRRCSRARSFCPATRLASSTTSAGSVRCPASGRSTGGASRQSASRRRSRRSSLMGR